MKYNFDINDRAFKAIKNKTKRVEIRTTKLGENHFDYGIPVSTIKTWKTKIDHPEKNPGQGQKRGGPKESNLTMEDWKKVWIIMNASMKTIKNFNF